MSRRPGAAGPDAPRHGATIGPVPALVGDALPRSAYDKITKALLREDLARPGAPGAASSREGAHP